MTRITLGTKTEMARVIIEGDERRGCVTDAAKWLNDNSAFLLDDFRLLNTNDFWYVEMVGKWRLVCPECGAGRLATRINDDPTPCYKCTGDMVVK
jgi:hypothetical protein